MTHLYRIEWTFHTSDLPDSGTDGRVVYEIWRDYFPYRVGRIEPGDTYRLDRGTVLTISHTPKLAPGQFPQVDTGVAIPTSYNYPDGIKDHLRVIFVNESDDAWRVNVIESKVFTGDVVPDLESGRLRMWRENPPLEYWFDHGHVLSQDPSEGKIKTTCTY